jgi:hypothetical protein
MMNETVSYRDLKGSARKHTAKILIACGVAAILCWLFIQSAQSSSVSGKAPGATKPDILTDKIDVLPKQPVVITKIHTADFTLGASEHF